VVALAHVYSSDYFPRIALLLHEGPHSVLDKRRRSIDVSRISRGIQGVPTKIASWGWWRRWYRGWWWSCRLLSGATSSSSSSSSTNL